ncbi:hypothetical protein D3C72_298410 [compost metagenome]
MASRISRSTTSWPPKPRKRSRPFKLDYRGGAENHLVLPYDGDFFSVYGDFLAEVDKIASRFFLGEEERNGMFALTNLATHVNIMVLEESGMMEDTEAFMDDCAATLEENAAAAFIEAVSDFHNSGIKPYGFEILRQIEAETEGFMVMEVIPMREEDSMVITVVNLSE